ncbi:hypothetical protein [Hymenobacter properus]|uniref:Lipoprotein n=1 Tax=Hymenobacter properus TaxID=2791026 RepID=A0A931BFD6_9BACT|nr:hypothetical protein [Hymenobacter properus]MBF9141272.1 hypothetical protein [Hymenobacter properus]MBR7720082.1 hypothetical protein [Microvirga sp. SRT04]
MRFSLKLGAASVVLLLGACQSDPPNTVASAAPVAADSSRREVPTAVPVTGSTSLPATQRLRLNDTLELECSQPVATFVTSEQPAPQTAWTRLALRGRRGWYQVLETNAYWTLYHASVAPDGSLFQLPTVGVEDQLDSGAHRAKKPLKVTEDDFFYNPYDLRHRTWTEYLDEELNALPARQIEAEYLGGEFDDKIYHPLPYWLAQEKARLQQTHRLPPPEQIAQYLELSQDTARHTGRLVPAYRPLLAELLRAYEPLSTSADTARLLQEAIRSLQVRAKTSK